MRDSIRLTPAGPASDEPLGKEFPDRVLPFRRRSAAALLVEAPHLRLKHETPTRSVDKYHSISFVLRRSEQKFSCLLRELTGHSGGWLLPHASRRPLRRLNRLESSIEVTGCMPIRALQIHRTAGGLEALCELLTPLGVVVKPNRVAPRDVAERSQGAKLYENGSVLVPGYRHTCFEQDVWSCLAGEFGLVRGITRSSE